LKVAINTLMLNIKGTSGIGNQSHSHSDVKIVLAKILSGQQFNRINARSHYHPPSKLQTIMYYFILL